MSVPPEDRLPPVGEPRSDPSLLTDATGDAEDHAFLIADVRGWTAFTQERGDEEAARLAARFADVSRSVVKAHRGNVLELRGDEALVVFGSPRWAIRGAVALQQRFVEETIADPSLPVVNSARTPEHGRASHVLRPPRLGAAAIVVTRCSRRSTEPAKRCRTRRTPPTSNPPATPSLIFKMTRSVAAGVTKC